MHLPQMFRQLGYLDAWCGEAKHKKYKGMIADSLQHLYSPCDGKLSQEVAGRILHSTLQDHLTLPSGVVGLVGKVHSEESVRRAAGVSCSISSSCKSGSWQYKTNDVLFWSTASEKHCAGRVEFFAVYDQAVVMIFPTGAKRAMLFADMLRIEMPTWWTVEQDCVVACRDDRKRGGGPGGKVCHSAGNRFHFVFRNLFRSAGNRFHFVSFPKRNHDACGQSLTFFYASARRG